jgi:hypothetical protein
MLKRKRAQQSGGLHAERGLRRAAASRIDRAMAERAEAGDRAFEARLERWKQNRTGI